MRNVPSVKGAQARLYVKSQPLAFGGDRFFSGSALLSDAYRPEMFLHRVTKR